MDIELELCRCDLGSGGWSLHTPDDKLILSGPSKIDKDGDWIRPNEEDYELARQLVQAECKRDASFDEDGTISVMGKVGLTKLKDIIHEAEGIFSLLDKE